MVFPSFTLLTILSIWTTNCHNICVTTTTYWKLQVRKKYHIQKYFLILQILSQSVYPSHCAFLLFFPSCSPKSQISLSHIRQYGVLPCKTKKVRSYSCALKNAQLLLRHNSTNTVQVYAKMSVHFYHGKYAHLYCKKYYGIVSQGYFITKKQCCKQLFPHQPPTPATHRKLSLPHNQGRNPIHLDGVSFWLVVPKKISRSY